MSMSSGATLAAIAQWLSTQAKGAAGAGLSLWHRWAVPLDRGAVPGGL